MASLILNDADAAGPIVVDTVVAASRRGQVYGRDHSRVRATLATSVYRRCLGTLALRERFGLPPVADTPTVAAGTATVALDWLSVRQRCTVALTIFGRHSLPSAARTLNLLPASVLHELEDALATITATAAPVGGMSAGRG
jgi:hypothetical protein